MKFRTILGLISGGKRRTSTQVHPDSAAFRRASPAPFHMYCDGLSDMLYPLSDGRFQLLYNRPIAPLMAGLDYVLAERPLADFLSARALDSVRFLPATIYCRRTGEEWRTHQQVIVGQRFHIDDRDNLPLDGERLLLIGGALFVSPALKDVIADSPFAYLKFSEAFSEFFWC